MGSAILNSLTGEDISFYEPDDERAGKIKAERTDSIEKGLSKADIVFLCVKPQVFKKFNPVCLQKPCIVISIMAGVTVLDLKAKFENAYIMRTMPNIAVSAKKGTVAIATDGVDENIIQTAEHLFSKCASTVRVSESQMDAVTGLSGSGPAFAFQFIEALAMGGVKMGLPRDAAMKLALSTTGGAVEMLEQSKANPNELTATVCSPGGTTIAGMQELENKAFRGTVMAAVEAAAKRSAELGMFILMFFSTLLCAKDIDLGHLAMCSGLKQCLNYEHPQCNAEEKKPNPDIKYNAEFCSPYLELKQRGLRTDDPRARDLFRYMGRQYRVTYTLNGTIPVSKEMMIYLFENMEFTAQLVNAYRKTKYTITYDTPDRKYFSGDNGDNLSGSFVWLLNDSAGVDTGMHHLFFGRGRTKILAWRLHGTATAVLDLKEASENSVFYEFRAIVSPNGAILNSIMNLGIFNSVVKGKIKEIIENIENAAKEFAKGNRKPIANYAPFKQEKWKKNLQEFEAIAKSH